MPVTLAQAKLNTTDDVDIMVIDEFRKESAILDALTFDDVVSPTGGGTLTYGYQRLITQPIADFRAINAEYVPAEVTKQRFSHELVPLGGSFQIDRVLANMGPAAASEVVLQMTQKIKATRTRFQDAVINGDTAVDANGFDGLDKALAGSTTEVNPTVVTDWTAISSQDDTPHQALDTLDLLLSMLDGQPTMIIGNKQALAKVRSIARRAGYYSRDRNEFGQTVETYGGVMLVDPGEKAGTNDPIIPIETRDPDGAGAGGNVTGLTDLYAVRFALDGFHGASMVGGELVKTWMPDFERAGAVKTGEVEMGPVGVALKATRAAAVLRNVKIQ